MPVWIMQAGPQGAFAEYMLENDRLTIGWGDFGSFDGIQTQQQMFDRIQLSNVHKTQGVVKFYARQLLGFVRGMKPGDLVVLRLKGQPTVAVGRVAGGYQYRTEAEVEADGYPEYPHVRAVQWLDKEVPRSALDPDLRNRLFANPWVFPWRPEDAEERVMATVNRKGGPEAEDGGEGPLSNVDGRDEGLDETQQDIGEQANAEIRIYVEQEFKEHEFAQLVGAVLRVQGYVTEVSPSGPDGGIDIMAGSGPLGFDKPRMCVQVKSGGKKADPAVLRALAGSVQNSRADYGLLVSWGGFTSATLKEARQNNYFNMRLWDSQALLHFLFEAYDRLPADIRARIPLKQIWIVADPSITSP